MMSITIDAKNISAIMTAILAGAGALQYMDWVNFLNWVDPTTAGGIIAIYNAFKIGLNAYTAATTKTVPLPAAK